MKINLIVAMDRNRGIGLNNQLLCHIPEDMKHFRQTTNGHVVVMGRKTFESIGRPLPNRTNVVMTGNKSYEADGCTVVNSFDDFCALCKEFEDREIFIIGGAEIYKMFMPLADKLYVTVIDHIFEADTFFPHIDETLWIPKLIRTIGGEYPCQFLEFVRSE